jgi:hypothetical protein
MSQILAPAQEAPVEPGQADEPAPAAPEPAPIPDKYRGKTTEQVIEMHQNAESRLGEIQNEVGQLRGLVTDLSAIQRTPEAPSTAVVEEVDVSGDDLLANPGEAVRSIIQPELDRIATESAVDKADTLVRTETAALMRDFADMDTTVASPEFMEFASRTAGRQADFNVAATGEGVDQVRAARRLLEDFADFNALVTPAQNPTPTPLEQARSAATEGSNTGAPVSTKPQMFESDVIALINSDPAKYRSPSFQAEMMEAMREGRFVKNS